MKKCHKKRFKSDTESSSAQASGTGFTLFNFQVTD